MLNRYTPSLSVLWIKNGLASDVGTKLPYMYQLQALQQHRLAVFGTGIFKSESWSDSLGSKDNGSSSIKRKKFSLSESMSLLRERKGNRANYCFAQSKRKG